MFGMGVLYVFGSVLDGGMEVWYPVWVVTGGGGLARGIGFDTL